MSSRARVYVARKECGCIVAAFPVNMDKAIKGELLKQFSKAGYDLEQASEYDVLRDFHLTCDHNKPPLLAYMDERTAEGSVAVASGEGIPSLFPNLSEIGEDTEGAVDLEEEHSFDEDEEAEDDGVDEADVNDLAGDISPEFEQADEAISQEEF